MTSIDPQPLKRGCHAATPEDFEPLGGEIMGRSTGGSAAVFVERWITFFGVVCAVVADVWNRLVEKDDPELESASPVHLLWALLFLKQYPMESVFCKLVGVKDKGTVRFWSQLFVRHIGYLVPDVVRDMELLFVGSSFIPFSCSLAFSLLCTDQVGESEAR